jgi:hypothetical protein
MTEAAKSDSEQPNVETESTQGHALPIEVTLPITVQTVCLVQAFGTWPVLNQVRERSPLDCLTAGPYVAPDVTLEELEHPALRRVKYLH